MATNILWQSKYSSVLYHVHVIWPLSIKVGIQLPVFLHILIPSSKNLTVKSLVNLLKPVFSEEGSNNRKYENEIYSVFMKYLRKVAGKNKMHSILFNIVVLHLYTIWCINSGINSSTFKIVPLLELGRLPVTSLLYLMYNLIKKNTLYSSSDRSNCKLQIFQK